MIETMTLHLGFPVSVDLPHKNSLSSRSSGGSSSKSKSSRRSKSNGKRSKSTSSCSSYQAFESHTPSSSQSPPSCHAMEWLEEVSTYYASLFSCGHDGVEHGGDVDCTMAESASNSILLQTPTKQQSANSKYPGITMARPLEGDDCQQQATTAKPVIRLKLTTTTPAATATTNDDELTTATSVTSIASWNTTPTSLADSSSSLLDGVLYLDSSNNSILQDHVGNIRHEHDDWMRCVDSTNQQRRHQLVGTPQSHRQSVAHSLSPSLLMRRCTSDPRQVERLNLQRVQSDVFPDLQMARPVLGQ